MISYPWSLYCPTLDISTKLAQTSIVRKHINKINLTSNRLNSNIKQNLSLNQPISSQQHLTNNSNIKQKMSLWCLCADRLTYPITKLSCVLCRLPDRLGQPPSAATPVWLHPSPGACMRYNGTSIMVHLCHFPSLPPSFLASPSLPLPLPLHYH